MLEMIDFGKDSVPANIAQLGHHDIQTRSLRQGSSYYRGSSLSENDGTGLLLRL